MKFRSRNLWTGPRKKRAHSRRFFRCTGCPQRLAAAQIEAKKKPLESHATHHRSSKPHRTPRGTYRGRLPSARRQSRLRDLQLKVFWRKHTITHFSRRLQLSLPNLSPLSASRRLQNAFSTPYQADQKNQARHHPTASRKK